MELLLQLFGLILPLYSAGTIDAIAAFTILSCVYNVVVLGASSCL